MKFMKSLVIAAVCMAIAMSQPLLVVHIFNYCASSPSANDQTVLPDPIWTRNSTVTPIGQRQCYLLGAEMYARYFGAVIPTPFDPRAVYARALDLERSQTSGQAYFLGLFAGQGRYINSIPASLLQMKGVFSNVLNLTTQAATVGPAIPNVVEPAPIHAISIDSGDWTLSSTITTVCPAFNDLATLWKNSDLRKTVDRQFGSYYNAIAASVGLQSNTLNLDNLKNVWQVLQSDYYANATMKLQPGTEKYNILNALRNIGQFGPPFTTELGRRLGVTPILSELMNWMDAKIQAKTNISFVALPANDIPMMAILAGFNITTPDCLVKKLQSGSYYDTKSCPDAPNFANGIIFELNQLANNTYVVKMTYNDVEYQVCDALRFSDGSLGCDYPYFQAWAKRVQVFDYYTSCFYGEIPFQAPETLDAYKTMVGIVGAIWLLSILIFFACCIRCCLASRKKTV